MISIQQMQYILSVNDNRHYQRASEACFVTQPTLSMQIKKAEDELGYLIFDRSTNPLTLTVFGEKLIVIIRDILVEIEKIPKLIKKSLKMEKIEQHFKKYMVHLSPELMCRLFG